MDKEIADCVELMERLKENPHSLRYFSEAFQKGKDIIDERGKGLVVLFNGKKQYSHNNEEGIFEIDYYKQFWVESLSLKNMQGDEFLGLSLIKSRGNLSQRELIKDLQRNIVNGDSFKDILKY